ncbi:Cna protein B-type domain protein [Corynebacterium glaucum]|uniref:Cna protein B-type domain protein n=2 Tax=Corynebacterium glaucum TaxID=187491 RepID=A0A1Q2HXA8_9CORY|nr:Cna protein B-type domain protein [Corynebacterium glaucum]WJZ07969.1 Cna protein B-type domain protein [Corynebacterium glaucum]
MPKMTHTMKARLLATSAATAVMLLTVPGGIADADAQSRPVSGNDGKISMQSVDRNRALSLKVTKAKGNLYDDTHEGELPEGRLEGVKFTLFIAPDIPVGTDADRDEASRARTKEEWDAVKREPVATQTTDSNGEVTFTNLAPGLYLLEELAPDAEHNYHTSAPQWIVLPLTDAYGTRFVYDNVMVVKPSPTTTPATPGVPSPPGAKETPAPPDTPPGKITTPIVTPPPATPPADTFPVDTPLGDNLAPNTPPEDSPVKPGPGRLAETGASVLLIVFVGLTLIGLGVLISRKKAK